jgi:hypothetical protein
MKSGLFALTAFACAALPFSGCAEFSKSLTAAKVYHSHPTCKQSKAKCKEYDRAEKANKQETAGLRLLREDCEGYQRVCDAEVNMAVQGYP